MKKVFLVLLILTFCSVALADNSARIADLQAQGQKIMQDIQQAQQFLQAKQAEVLKIQGAIEELSRVVTEQPKLENESKG